jgi:hypothetical protein
MTDIPRWTEIARQPESPWLPRLRLLAEHVAPGEVVIDVGAGGRSLRTLIDPSCLYIPVDCVPGSPVYYDFNEYDPTPRLSGNVAVLSGFLEYTQNPRSALLTILRWAPRVLMSYAPSIGDDLLSRKRSGWVNHFSIERLEECLARVGNQHRLIGEWEGQVMYEVKR